MWTRRQRQMCIRDRYITSTFEYHEYYEECEKQSNTQGGIESCVDFMIKEAKK